MFPKQPELPIQVLEHAKGKISSSPISTLEPLVSVCYSMSKCYVLSSSYVLYSLHKKALSKIPYTQTITKIYSSSKTLLLLGTIGVYYVGLDLFTSNVTYSISPVQGLEQLTLSEASISNTHAAGIDDLGNLYLWGGVQGAVHSVDSSSLFSSYKVICGNNATCVVTNGGYVYIIGEFLYDSPVGVPYTLPELEKYFIVDVCIGNDFCAVLTEEGAVLGFDRTKEIVRMPGVTGLKAIVAYGKGVYGISAQSLYRWYGSVLNSWELEMYSIQGELKILGNSDKGIVTQGNFALELVKTIEPYKISYETLNLVASMQESKDNLVNNYLISPKALVSPIKNNLYKSFFASSDTFTKILGYRKQNQQTEGLCKAINPLVLSKLEYVWERLRIYNENQAALNKTFSYIQLPVLIDRIVDKTRFIHLAFGFEKINRFSKEFFIKEIEKYRDYNANYRYKNEKIDLVARKIAIKAKQRFAKVFIGIIKTVIKKTTGKIKSSKKIVYFDRKVEKLCLKKYFYRWVALNHYVLTYSKALNAVCELALRKQGYHAFKCLKAFRLVKNLKITKRKSVLKSVLKKSYIKDISLYYNIWSKLTYNLNAKRHVSKKLYTSLSKNIYTIINHKLKNNLKWSFASLESVFINWKLIKQYKNPILYFNTVVSKIICRLRFSVFTSVYRVKEKPGVSVNLFYLEKINSMWFILQKKYFDGVKVLFSVQESYDASIGKIKNTSVLDNPDQTMTFFRRPEDSDELRDKIPRLKLKIPKYVKKPPISCNNHPKIPSQTPWKAPNRSGSYGGASSRDGSLTRRKEYDTQLRKKHKNNEKFFNKNDDSRSSSKALKNKPKKMKLIELKPRSSSEINKTTAPKISLGILALKRFITKNLFTKTLLSFKVLKTCYLYSKSNQSKCFKYNPENN